MAVQFILGRSGTGKTTCCINAVIDALQDPENSQSLILLVPEQATYQAERAILSDKKIPGYHRLSVLSFNRLSFMLLGKDSCRPEVSRTARTMIIQKILREQKDNLEILGSSALRGGLSGRLTDVITELHQYDKDPEDIDELMAQLKKNPANNVAAMKFADIRLIFAEYLRFIEGRFIDGDLQLARAREAIGRADFVKGAKLWVDGFSSFTSAELAVLEELLASAAETGIALCLDPDKIDPAAVTIETLDPLSIFNTTETTYAELLRIIRKRKLELSDPVILTRQARSPAGSDLSYLERNIFEPRPQKTAAGESIGIFSAPDMRSEVRFVGREICKLVREKNMRYRDIAVIASDLDDYQYYIRPYFEDLGIPFFIDRARALNQHPVVQLLCSALRVVTEGFAHSDIFEMLKTSLFADCKNDDMELLENYCIAFGITGRDWQSESNWRFADEDKTQFDQPRIDKIRRHILGPLIKFRDIVCPRDNPEKPLPAEEFTFAVFTFLNDLSVPATLARWIDLARGQGDSRTVDTHEQFYNKFVDIFDELNGVFADSKISCRDWLTIIDSAFSQLKLAFIPPALDQVLVGSIDRSRHPDLKAVFLIGATQKLFPRPVGSTSLLTDTDRLAAEALNFKIAATTSEELTRRQYLAYIAFTRPGELLTITYPAADNKQAPNTRSLFLDNIEALFDGLEEKSVISEELRPNAVYTEAELSDLLCRDLGKDAPENIEKAPLNQLIDNLRTETRFKTIAENFDRAVNYDNTARLDKTLAASALGKIMTSSVSRLSTFAKCPYQYFAKYTLGLKKRETFEFEPMDLGNFYHRLLDALLKKLNQENKNFADIDSKELLRILSGEISGLFESDRFISNFIAHGRHNQFIIHCAAETLENCALAIAKMARAGNFNPALSEVSFGHKEDLLGEYEILLPDSRKVLLRGVIDRLDIADCDGEKIALVFDYKSKGKPHDFCRLYYGLDMQLAGYILALKNARSSKITRNVAGAFYMPIEAPPKNKSLNELSETDDPFDHKAKGIFNGRFAEYLDTTQPSGWNRFYNFYISKKDNQYGYYNKSGALKPQDFETLLKFTERKIAELARSIFDGKIDINPCRLGSYSPCKYCDYKALCRFDWLINEPALLEGMDKRETLEMMTHKND